MDYCKTCALYNPEHSFCTLNSRKVNEETDFCSKHASQDKIGKCAICGQLFLRPGILEEITEDNWIEICHQCSSQFGTCAMCQNHDNCKFTEASYRPDLPPFVMTTQRQGNMVIQQQVPNPERIKTICQTECKCWYEGGCARNIAQTCGNYKDRR